MARELPRDKAKRIWLEEKGMISRRKLAKLIGNCTSGQIARWKRNDKWDADLSMAEYTEFVESKFATQLDKTTPKNKGGGKGLPAGEPCSIITGRTESIYFSKLTEAERNIYFSMDEIKTKERLEEEIRLLTIRQLRMLRRIDELEADHTVAREKKVSRGFNGGENYVDLEEVTTLNKVEELLRLESGLTQLNAQLTKTIKQLQDLSYDTARLQHLELSIEKLKIQVKDLREGDQSVEDKLADLFAMVGGAVDEYK